MTTVFLDNLSNDYDTTPDVDVVYGLDGNDRIDTHEMFTPYTLYGGDGNDTMRGYDAADFLFGGRGNDVLAGYDGNNFLEGGPGHDQFWFAFDTTAGKDTIADFRVGEDVFGFDTGSFSGLGPDGTLAAKKFYIGHHAHDGNDRVIYNDDKGKLIYDHNGNHSGGETVVAKLAPHLHLTHNDILVGNFYDLYFA
jgi:Ca2+-binding RTX toxin-like protein